MVRAYLSYENYIKEKKKHEFPFYLEWILSWEAHGGALEISDPEVLADGGEKCMEKFVKSNEAIGEFRVTRMVPDEDLMGKVTHILTLFHVRQIKVLRFTHTNLTAEALEKFVLPISHQKYLEILDLSYNRLDSSSLETMAKYSLQSLHCPNSICPITE
jgi:hypothetical protein